MILSATPEFCTDRKMQNNEKFICGDCKGITQFHRGKRGSAFVEFILWSIFFFPGIFYSIWRRKGQKKICQYCDSDFLLPADSASTMELLKTPVKNKL